MRGSDILAYDRCSLSFFRGQARQQAGSYLLRFIELADFQVRGEPECVEPVPVEEPGPYPVFLGVRDTERFLGAPPGLKSLGGLCKTWLFIHRQVLLPGTYENFPTRLVNARQRLLRPIERRFPRQTFPSRRSRCGSSVCQDWTKSNSANLSTV